MNWLSGAFTFANMAPADMILARHCEVLRADTLLVSLFGGAGLDEEMIRAFPIGKAIPLDMAPALFCSLPITDRKPSPGGNLELVTVRDIVQFHLEAPTDEEDLWEPGLSSLISHITGVVQTSQQLAYDTVNNGGPNAGVVMLATRVDLPTVSMEEVQALDNSFSLFRLNLDFVYSVQVNAKTIPPRIWPLVTVGA